MLTLGKLADDFLSRGLKFFFRDDELLSLDGFVLVIFDLWKQQGLLGVDDGEPLLEEAVAPEQAAQRTAEVISQGRLILLLTDLGEKLLIEHAKQLHLAGGLVHSPIDALC